ncbi:MAG: cation:proton antiporter [Gemmataceae bacterium]
MDSETILLSLVGLVVVGIGSQWLAWYLKLPSILLLLASGFVVGPVLDLLDPDDFLGDLLFPLVSLAVALILFEGGLSLRLRHLREAGTALWSLLSVGVLVTWALGTLGALYILGWDWPKALLMGSILIVTGPTVVGPLLRHIRPAGRVGPIANWEGIIVDPIGAVVAVLVYNATIAAPETPGLGSLTFTTAIGIVDMILVGGAVGLASAALLITLLRKYWVPDSLQSPFVLMLVLAVFGLANAIEHEAGLLAVTIMGLVMANQRWVPIKHIVEFKENLRVLLITALFLVLMARLEWDEFVNWSGAGLLFAAWLILVVRPASVWLATAYTGLTRKERLFLAWMAPRGIVAASVASVFALRLGNQDGVGLAPVTFLVIIATVTVYGFTAFPLARRLGLASADPQGVLIASATPGNRAIAHALKEAGFRALLFDTRRDHVTQSKLEGLECVYGSIFAHESIENLDLSGIGRFLALTSNDEVNSLGALGFTEMFGRAEVYQLPPASLASNSETEALVIHGRVLFAAGANHEYLSRRFSEGAVIKRTRLTKEFDYAAFRQLYGESALVMFVVQPKGTLTICTVDTPVANLKPDQTIIAMVDPAAKEGKAAAKGSPGEEAAPAAETAAAQPSPAEGS